MNENEIFLILNHLDPEKKVGIRRKVFEGVVKNIGKKEEAAKTNDEFEK